MLIVISTLFTTIMALRLAFVRDMSWPEATGWIAVALILGIAAAISARRQSRAMGTLQRAVEDSKTHLTGVMTGQNALIAGLIRMPASDALTTTTTATTTIVDLTSEVERLKEQIQSQKMREWPRLTPEQKLRLAARLEEIGALPISVTRNDTVDCMALALDFVDVVTKAKWSLPQSEPYHAMGGEPPGIAIRGPLGAKSEALQRAITEVTGLVVTLGDKGGTGKFNDEEIVWLGIGLRPL